MASNRYAPIRWVKSQVDKLDRAVQAYNEAIDDAMKRYAGTGLAFLLPEKADVASEIDMISTSTQLNMRVASLNRITRPGALDIDTTHQMTNYEYKEGVIAKSVVNRWRLQRLRQLGGNVKVVKGKYVPADTYTRRLINETSLMPNQSPVTPENVNHLRTMAFQYSGGNVRAIPTYFINYLREWRAYYSWTPEYEEVRSIIVDLMDQPTQVMNNVFYDYDYYGTFDYLYPGADRTPLLRKSANILSYWREMKRKWWDK